MKFTALVLVSCLALAAGQVNYNPVTITVTSPPTTILATPITPALPYSQAAYQCNVTGDSRYPAYATGTFPLNVSVPVGTLVRIVFANGNLGGTSVTQQGQAGVIVQQGGAVIVQQAGGASPIVQNPGSPVVQQSAPPAALVVQQSPTVVQPGSPSSPVVQPVPSSPTPTTPTPVTPTPGTPAPTTPAPKTTTPAPTTPAPTTTTPAPTTPAPTTPAPMTTTPAPMTTTPAPMTTTPAPMTTTPAPMTTTPAPMTTTPAPMTTTPAPMTTTPAPMTTTPAPMTTTPAPMTTTPAPMTTTPPPTWGKTPKPCNPDEDLQTVDGVDTCVKKKGGRKLLQNTVPGGPNNGLVEYVGLRSSNTVPGFVVPNTQFGVPYVEFTASAANQGQVASFMGNLVVAQVNGGVPQIPFVVNPSLSPFCQVNVNFRTIAASG